MKEYEDFDKLTKINDVLMDFDTEILNASGNQARKYGEYRRRGLEPPKPFIWLSLFIKEQIEEDFSNGLFKVKCLRDSIQKALNDEWILPRAYRFTWTDSDGNEIYKQYFLIATEDGLFFFVENRVAFVKYELLQAVIKISCEVRISAEKIEWYTENGKRKPDTKEIVIKENFENKEYLEAISKGIQYFIESNQEDDKDTFTENMFEFEEAEALNEYLRSGTYSDQKGEQMKTIELKYDPYRMKTELYINGIDACQNESYDKFKEFIENKIPLQTWVEPISYLDWQGFVNEISDSEYNDEVSLVFSGRKIDFDDLKRAIKEQNGKRSKEVQVIYHYQYKKVLDDKILSQNIENVVAELKSDRFRELVSQRTTEGLTQKYEDLDENYTIAKENVFYIVLAGVYSSGKSTLLNTLIKHDILPTSSRTCTSKNCRIRHDSSLGSRISLVGYGAKDEESGIEPIIIKKRIYETDEDCAAAFLKICPIKEKNIEDNFPDVETMEIGVDLSHLYPESVNKENFTIVLIDTPGMNSAQSSKDGSNKHAELALEAISMESKPMIILCVDANTYEDKSIGEFMREIVAQAQEEGSGFNDRFLFLMNKSDSIQYKQGETAEAAKAAFAEYVTDSSKWNIEGNEDDLKQLAEEASHFVPRVFMTASLMAFAIQKGARDFTDEELDDPYKEDLRNKLNGFVERICGPRKRPNYYLSKYCDIPNYRKDEIDAEFEQAIENEDQIHATKLQCGIVSVELAIKDYIERYAYPIKVRGLLDTFEDILEDVNGFTVGVLADLKQRKIELGEKSSKRREESEKKQSVNEKIAVLEKTKRKIDEQLKVLNNIKFDSNALRNAIGEFRVDIEEDKEIVFIRRNPKVITGQKTHYEVENEINSRIANIKALFERTLKKTNKKLEEIKSVHDKQILGIFDMLKISVAELENSGVFKQGEYKFKDSVLWKMNFVNINSDSFVSDLKKKVVDCSITTKSVRNSKKDEWSSSWNPFKKIGSWFMDEYKSVPVIIDGYYETTDVRKSIDGYLHNLQIESTDMENNFKKIMEDSKKKVCDLTDRLLRELTQFLEDIKTQETRIEHLGNSISQLNAEIEKSEETVSWLNNLKEMIEEDK